MAVRYEVIDEIARITLDRPETANSVTVDIALAIDAYVQQFATDDQVHALVVTGVGDRSFCAGGAIKTLPECADHAQRSIYPAWCGYCTLGSVLHL